MISQNKIHEKRSNLGRLPDGECDVCVGGRLIGKNAPDDDASAQWHGQVIGKQARNGKAGTDGAVTKGTARGFVVGIVVGVRR